MNRVTSFLNTWATPYINSKQYVKVPIVRSDTCFTLVYVCAINQAVSSVDKRALCVIVLESLTTGLILFRLAFYSCSFEERANTVKVQQRGVWVSG